MAFLTARQTSKTALSELQFAMASSWLMLDFMIADADKVIGLLQRLADDMLNEHAFGKTMKFQLDQKFRKKQGEIQVAFDCKLVQWQSEVALLGQTIRVYTQRLVHRGLVPLEDYCASILHMHLNRLFAENSRKKEAVTYFLMHKFASSNKARQRVLAGSATRVDR